jgi:anti-sigma factor RsiW
MLAFCPDRHCARERRVEHDDISCSHFIRTLSDYRDGELVADDERRSRLHVENCPDCASYLRNYEATMRIGRESLSEDLAAEALPASLVQGILAARRRTS